MIISFVSESDRLPQLNRRRPSCLDFIENFSSRRLDAGGVCLGVPTQSLCASSSDEQGRYGNP